MTNVLLVGIGGFLGSAARFLVTGVITQASTAARFPYGTLVVNAVGCLAIGVIAGLAERADLFSPQARLVLVTGILGGFTTFSAFAFETYFLGREHQWMLATVNVLAQVALGLAAVWLGHAATAGNIPAP
jgi:CrcB protein